MDAAVGVVAVALDVAHFAVAVVVVAATGNDTAKYFCCN